MPGLDGATIRRRLADARLYLCTDARRQTASPSDTASPSGTDSLGAPDLRALAALVDAALAGGVDIVQLRDKGHPTGPLEAKQELAALQVIAEACARHGALLSVNDRADIALAAQADVLHLGQDDLPLSVARRILGEDIVIGRSTHDVEQVDAAATEPGLDYFCVGPCWPTPTKPGRPAPGLDLVRHAARVQPPGSGRPWFAIGGIGHDRLDEVLAAGADRVVVVRAITGADEPAQAAHTLATRLRTAPEPDRSAGR